jgi:outer membrane protein TolC
VVLFQFLHLRNIHARLSRPAALCASFAVAVASSGCILTTDLPDPALDIPAAYKSDTSRNQEYPPTLDWWRAFKSRELTSLIEEAHSVNLDIAAATARILQADALARQAGASLFPALNGDASITRSKSSETATRRANNVFGDVERELRDRFLGQES